MQTFIAHYHSPNASAQRSMGLFEFQSEGRVGSKENTHDARMAMLTQFGNDAVSWTIDSIERKTAASKDLDGQLALDFREPVEQPKHAKKVVRGRL